MGDYSTGSSWERSVAEKFYDLRKAVLAIIEPDPYLKKSVQEEVNNLCASQQNNSADICPDCKNKAIDGDKLPIFCKTCSQRYG